MSNRNPTDNKTDSKNDNKTAKGTIVITGVGQRIGRALAQSLQQQGHQVVGSYRSQRPELDQLSALGVRLFQVDFYQPEQLQSWLAFIDQQGPLRALIHNASDWLAEPSTLDFSINEASQLFDRMLLIHAKLPYLMNLHCAPALQACERADVIHISDYVSQKGSRKHLAYAASKAALDNLSLSFAARFAPTIRVNSIQPSLIAFNDHDDAEYRQSRLAKSLLGIEPGFAEVVTAVNYLLESQYMTGRTLNLDGGRHLV